MSEVVDCIRTNVHAGAYEAAYSIGRDALREPECDRGQIIAALCELTARLRSGCMGLAAKKNDLGPDYEVLENLLRKANELTGQDMYGSFVKK